LIWDDRQFGDVRATLTKLDDGISLKELRVTAASFSATAKGEWRGKDAGLARVEGTLTSTDVAATMKDLGYDAVIEAKTGKMDFDLSWVGAPTSQALSVATGRVQVALDKGQLTSLKPVSYTHLDVYKRQRSTRSPARSASRTPAIVGRCWAAASGRRAPDAATRIRSSTRAGAPGIQGCSSCG